MQSLLNDRVKKSYSTDKRIASINNLNWYYHDFEVLMGYLSSLF